MLQGDLTEIRERTFARLHIQQKHTSRLGNLAKILAGIQGTEAAAAAVRFCDANTK